MRPQISVNRLAIVVIKWNCCVSPIAAYLSIDRDCPRTTLHGVPVAEHVHIPDRRLDIIKTIIVVAIITGHCYVSTSIGCYIILRRHYCRGRRLWNLLNGILERRLLLRHVVLYTHESCDKYMEWRVCFCWLVVEEFVIAAAAKRTKIYI